MLPPPVLGHSQHLGLGLALSYISPWPIFAQNIKISLVFMILSRWVLIQILLEAKGKKMGEKKGRKKSMGCGRKDNYTIFGICILNTLDIVKVNTT